MISVSTAKDLILKLTPAIPAQTFSLTNAVGLILAEDILAQNDFPPFRQSTMDGYGFCFDDWNGEPLVINGEVQAGATERFKPGTKQAVRIFTGAPVPDSVDTIVMQEKTYVNNGALTILDNDIVKGINVRPQGSEIKNGALGLQAGTYLSPGAIGFLAGMGTRHVQAVPKPKVSIIVTGKELQKPGEPLFYGQVYESNSYALNAALKQCGITSVTINTVDDDLELLTQAIRKELLAADLLLITGGVSVGNYDFVSQALEQAGVEKVFHKVKQRPGKPLLFAKRENKIIFGLPGNPSSVLTCFYEYVLIAIQQMTRASEPILKTIQLPIGADYYKNTGLTHFLKGSLNTGHATPLDAQESYRMKSFAIANCLIVLDESKNEFKKGDVVEVHILF